MYHSIKICLDLIECFRGNRRSEISPKGAANELFDRLLKGLSNWAVTTKCYTILHRCLRDTQLATPMA